jgi:tetratricopeptide (TPR) repeat protein
MKSNIPIAALKILTSSLVLLFPFALVVHALEGGGSQEPSATSGLNDPNYRSGKKAAKAKDWSTAIRYLEQAVKSDPQNADAWNYLGFSYRKSGNLNKAFPAYEQALKIDPKHRGAYEYLGEAYLQSGNLPKAQAQLDRLVKICGQNCEESKDLQKAIEVYKAAKSGSGGK